MHLIWTELRETLRQLRRSAGFSLLAGSLLAVGLGATVAVFSLLHSIVLRPLPFHEPEQLVGVQAVNQTKGIVQDGVSVSDYHDFATTARSFSSAGAFRPNFAAYTRPGEAPLRLVTGLITSGLIETLGVQPALGRTFLPGEFSATSARTVLLSHALWQRLFAGRADVLGQVLLLDDEPCTVIGIMPEAFREPAFVDAWLPFPRESPEYYARDSRFWTMIGRLAPHASIASARAELADLAVELARRHPETNRDWTVSASSLQELRTGPLRPALLLLFGAVALVLVIACLNLANLLLVRGLARLPELGVRLALGATPRRLAARVLAESLALATGGAVAGLALAWVALPLVTRRLPPGLIPRAHEIALHPGSLAVAAAAACLCALLCGLLPASQVLRVDVDRLLKGGSSRGATSGTARWQAVLVISQIALTVTVLTGALLLMKSLHRLQDVPIGFDPRGVLTLRLSPPPQRYETTAELAHYYHQLIEAAAAVPGVGAAAVNASTPLNGITLTYPSWLAEDPRDAAAAREAVYAPVSAGYFEMVRQPLRHGRTFTAHDRRGGAPVAIINETYARQAFPDGQALGRRVLILPWMGDVYREIVGVVADTRQADLSSPPPAQIYVPQEQMPWFFSTLLVRLDRPGALPALQAALQAVDPTLPFAPSWWSDDIAETAIQPRLYAHLFAAFGFVAVGISAFGIYASLRFTLHQRRREIGLRMALGAAPQNILVWMLARTGRWVAAGLTTGLAAALPLAFTLRHQLFGVAPFDPAIVVLLPMGVLAIALLAALPTALRARRIRPAQALQAID